MTTITYNIEFQRTKFSTTTTHKVDRTYPTAILNGHYSESEFISFCDRVDHTIASFVGPRRAKYICFWSALCCVLCPHSTFEFDKENTEKLNGQIRKVCEDASRESSYVSFHLREPKVVGTVSGREGPATNKIVSTAHIEVVLSENHTSDPIASVPIVAVPTIGYSPAARLAELDAMKHLLSDQEYEQKRNEIVSSL